MDKGQDHQIRFIEICEYFPDQIKQDLRKTSLRICRGILSVSTADLHVFFLCTDRPCHRAHHSLRPIRPVLDRQVQYCWSIFESPRYGIFPHEPGMEVSVVLPCSFLCQLLHLDRFWSILIYYLQCTLLILFLPFDLWLYPRRVLQV